MDANKLLKCDFSAAEASPAAGVDEGAARVRPLMSVRLALFLVLLIVTGSRKTLSTTTDSSPRPKPADMVVPVSFPLFGVTQGAFFFHAFPGTGLGFAAVSGGAGGVGSSSRSFWRDPGVRVKKLLPPGVPDTTVDDVHPGALEGGGCAGFSAC